MRKVTVVAVFLCVLLIFAGCATTSGKEVPAADENRLVADFDPFMLGNAMGLRKSGSSMKPVEMELYYIPRKDIMELYFSYSMDKVCLTLSSSARDSFEKFVYRYMESYDSKSFENRKPTADNAYGRISTDMYWGVFAYAYETNTKIEFNYEFIDEKPYFRMDVKQGRHVSDDSIYSPNITMYFTPVQLEEIFSMASIDVINEVIAEKERTAFSFDY